MSKESTEKSLPATGLPSITTTSILPTDYCPQTIDQFFGPARVVAKRLAASAAMCRPTGSPAAHLMVGPSGTGKTALAHYALDAFEVHPWNRTIIFGADLTKEYVQEIAYSMRLTSMYPGYRAWLFDEIDKATKEARDRLLEVVGDRQQPRQSVILATSNLTVKEIDALEKSEGAKGRFTGRFQVHEVLGPNAVEITPLLTQWLPPELAAQYAAMSAVNEDQQTIPINCRALLKDVMTYLEDQHQQQQTT